MKPKETTEQKLSRVARELGVGMRKQAVDRWDGVRTAKRNLGNRHVWRFRTGGGDPDRFVLFSNRAMTSGEDPATTLLTQLNKARWLDRLQSGPETSFQLGSGGRLRPVRSN